YYFGYSISVRNTSRFLNSARNDKHFGGLEAAIADPHLNPLPSKGEEENVAAQLHFSHFTFVFFVNANFANLQNRHLLRQPPEIFAKLRVRMRVRRGRKRDSFFDRELNDAIGGIKLVNVFAHNV